MLYYGLHQTLVQLAYSLMFIDDFPVLLVSIIDNYLFVPVSVALTLAESHGHHKA